jgi:hypothetical protein
MHLWDRLLHQAKITIDLLHTSILHPQLSASAHFHRLIDYNKTSFAPPGCNIIAHEKPSQRRSWEPHGQPGYSLGPAMHHYRCQNVYITSTASERIVDTLEFPLIILQCNNLLHGSAIAHDMTDALKHPHPDVHFSTIGDDTITVLTTLSAIFKTSSRSL